MIFEEKLLGNHRLDLVDDAMHRCNDLRHAEREEDSIAVAVFLVEVDGKKTK